MRCQYFVKFALSALYTIPITPNNKVNLIYYGQTGYKSFKIR